MADFKPVSVSSEGDVLRYMFMKKHVSSGDSELPNDRTLFLTNLPLEATEEEIRQFFSHCGTIKEVRLKSIRRRIISEPTTYEDDDEDALELLIQEEEGLKRSSYPDYAHIIFDSKKGLQKALSLNNVQLSGKTEESRATGDKITNLASKKKNKLSASSETIEEKSKF